MKDRATIGRKIVRDLLHLQAEVGITNTKLAKKAGISTSTLYHWQKALKNGANLYPQYPTIEMVLNALGQTLTIMGRNEK